MGIEPAQGFGLLTHTHTHYPFTATTRSEGGGQPIAAEEPDNDVLGLGQNLELGSGDYFQEVLDRSRTFHGLSAGLGTCRPQPCPGRQCL